MIKIAHLGSYDSNIGDNIALLNARKGIEKYCDEEIVWEKLNLSGFHDMENDTEFCIAMFRKISRQNDLLLIGGGGLVQYQPKYHNKFNLPFTEEILEHVTIPIVVCGVGFNTFRGAPVVTEEIDGKSNVVIQKIADLPDRIFLKNLYSLMKKAALFSFRTDGSVNSIAQIYHTEGKGEFDLSKLDSIWEAPDPGLVYDYEVERKEKLENGLFQPAWNRSANILNGRFIALSNISEFERLRNEFELAIFPHCTKDYDMSVGINNLKYIHLAAHPYFETTPEDKKNLCWNGTFKEKDYIMSKEKFDELIKFESSMEILNRYLEYDYSVAMRGHGQMIAIGLNIPSIYLSTQQKVLEFSAKNGFMDYTVDITSGPGWHGELLDKTKRLLNDKNYLLEWYKQRDHCISVGKQQLNVFCQETVKIINDAKRGDKNE